MSPEKTIEFNLGSMIYALIIFTYSFFFLFYYADWKDNGIRFSVKTLPIMIGSYIVNLFVGFLSQVVGLIRCGDQQHWAKTEHAIGASQTMAGGNALQLPSKAA